MQISFSKKILIPILIVLFMPVRRVFGQSVDIIPPELQGVVELLGFEGTGLADFVSTRFSQLLGYGFLLMFILAIIYTGIAAFDYFKSQGDAQEIEKASTSAGNIIKGFGAIIVAVIGMVLIFVFLGAPFFQTRAYQTCLSGADSYGCEACRAPSGGLIENYDVYREVLLLRGTPVIPPTLATTAFTEISNGRGDNTFTLNSTNTGGIVPAGQNIDVSYNQLLCGYCELEYTYKSENGNFIFTSTASDYCENIEG